EHEDACHYSYYLAHLYTSFLWSDREAIDTLLCHSGHGSAALYLHYACDFWYRPGAVVAGLAAIGRRGEETRHEFGLSGMLDVSASPSCGWLRFRMYIDGVTAHRLLGPQ